MQCTEHRTHETQDNLESECKLVTEQEIVQLHSIPSEVTIRWDKDMMRYDLKCLGGNETWSFGGFVLGYLDANLCN